MVLFTAFWVCGTHIEICNLYGTYTAYIICCQTFSYFQTLCGKLDSFFNLEIKMVFSPIHNWPSSLQKHSHLSRTKNFKMYGNYEVPENHFVAHLGVPQWFKDGQTVFYLVVYWAALCGRVCTHFQVRWWIKWPVIRTTGCHNENQRCSCKWQPLASAYIISGLL